MIHLNTFSVIDLFTAICLVGMMVALFYRYWRVTQRFEEVLLVVVLFFLCCYCLASAGADNIVPSGELAAGVPGAARRTLFYYRLMYVAVTLGSVTAIHFSLRYCGSVRLQGRRPLWLYLIGLLICPIFWSSAFLRAPQSPLGLTSSWLCSVPWQPDFGALGYVYAAGWLATNAQLQLRFWRRFRHPGPKKSHSFTSHFVWTGVGLWGLAGIVGLGLAPFGYAGVDPTPPIIAVSLLLLAIGLGEEYTLHERQRLHVTRRFKSYIDPALVEYVMDHPEQEHFDGEVRDMTVVFTDLEGFTTLSEKLREGIVPLLNEYLKVMTPLIREHHGYRNKWLGDGMMFFYGAPEKNPDHAIHAVATVLKMQEMMLTFNESLEKQRETLGADLPQLVMRTGVSTGKMVVGDAGPSDASDYTAIGTSVNLGARLESANKALGTRILLSQRTITLLPVDLFLIRPVGKLKLIGIASPEPAYEPLAPFQTATATQKRCAQLTTEMVAMFQAADFAACLVAENLLTVEIGSSKLAGLYRQLCQQYLLVPPPADFAGEIILSSK